MRSLFHTSSGSARSSGPGRALSVMLAVALAAACLFAGLPRAQAAPLSTLDMTANAELILTKLEQPEELGTPASGRPVNVDGPRIAGVSFAVTPVTLDHPLNTVAGWEQAATMTLAQAQQRLAKEPLAGATTNSQGVARVTGLPVGLYYVEETAAGPGVIPAEPMLIPLPIADPSDESAWLYRVHVYPKNSTVDIDVQVVDEHVVTGADPQRWRAVADLPRVTDLTSYSVRLTIPAGLELVGEPTVAVLHGADSLNDSDYVLRVDGVGIVLELTEAGIAKVLAARAENADAAVEIRFETTASGNGEYTVTGSLTAAITDQPSLAAEDAATTKFGSLAIQVVEAANPQRTVPGAGFRVYLTPEDALAGTNPVTVDGVSRWYSNAEGYIEVPGLRFSRFVNGLDRAPEDRLSRTFYVMLTYIPEGYTGTPRPIALDVVSARDPQVALVELFTPGAEDPGPGTSTPDDPDNPGAPGGGGGDSDRPGEGSPASGEGGSGTGPDHAEDPSEGPLAVTGVQVTGIALLAAVLIGVGLLLKRRRRDPQPLHE